MISVTRIRLLLLLLMLAGIGNTYAQAPFRAVSKHCVGGLGAFGRSLVAHADGSYSTVLLATPLHGLIVSTFDACHQLIWSREIADMADNGAGDGYRCCATDDGGVLVTYHDRSGMIMVCKLSNAGAMDWTRRLDLPAQWYFGEVSCIQAANGDFLTAGYMDSLGGTQHRYINLTSFSSKGISKWSKTYTLSTDASDHLYGLQLFALQGGGCYIFTEVYDSKKQLTPLSMRIDSLGNVMWAKTVKMPGSQMLLANEAAIDATGSIYLYENFGYYFDNYLPSVLKISSTGSALWMHYYTGTSTVSRVLDGGIDVGNGELIYWYFADGFSTVCVRTDLNGKPLWAKDYMQPAHELFIFDGRITADSGFLCMSDLTSDVNISADSNHTVILKADKYGYTGCHQWDLPVTMYNGSFSLVNYSLTSKPGISTTNKQVVSLPYKDKETIICANDFYPQADLGNDTILCQDTSYTLSARQPNPNCFYTWSTGSTDTAITIHKSGRYWLSINHNNCTATDTVNVIFYQKIPKLREHVHYTCPYDSVLLTTPDSAIHTVWLTPKGKELDKKTIWARDTSYYYIKLTGNGHCLTIDSIYISHYALPKASAGADTLLCYNQSYTMHGKGGVTYQWTPAKYLSSDTLPDAIARAPITQQYTLIVRNAHGCADTSAVWLRVRPPLGVKITGMAKSYCNGDSIKLSAVAKGGDSTHYSFYWPNDKIQGKQLHIKGYTAAWHKIVLQDGCSPDAVDSVYIKVPPAPVAAFDIAPSALSGDEISFINQSQNSQRYYWSFGDSSNNNSTTAYSPVYAYRDTGRYKVVLIAYGINGCSDTAARYIHISDGFHVYIPNAFSPNDDGLNELFQIKGTAIASYSYSIYNRWGECIFQSSPAQPYWNGSVHNQGETVQEGVYLYMLKVKALGGREYYYSGMLHLVR